MGKKVEVLKKNKVVPPALSNYAYLMEWNEYYTPKALNSMLQFGLKVKVGMKPFSINKIDYDYGTILIPIQNQKLNKNDLHAFIKEIAIENNVIIRSVDTDLTKGIDLGSSNFKNLDVPKIALIIGDGIASYDAGEIWHLLDQRYNIRPLQGLA